MECKANCRVTLRRAGIHADSSSSSQLTMRSRYAAPSVRARERVGFLRLRASARGVRRTRTGYIPPLRADPA